MRVHDPAVAGDDPARVEPEIREEAVDGLEGFPHIYGPMNLDAVTEVRPRDTANTASCTPWLKNRVGARPVTADLAG
jgi:hypothetical protein